MGRKHISILLVILVTLLAGCTTDKGNDIDDLLFLKIRREHHIYLGTEIMIGEYEVLEKGHSNFICQAEVLSTVYYSESGEFFSFNETECTADPTYYVYYNNQYLTFNEAVKEGIIIDDDVVEFCRKHVLVTLLIEE